MYKLYLFPAGLIRRNSGKFLWMIILLLTSCLQFACNHENNNTRHPGMAASAAYDSVRLYDSIVNMTRISNPEIARIAASKALKLAHGEGDHQLNAKIYLIAGLFFQLNQPDSAYNYFQAALQETTLAGNDTVKPRILYNIAMMYKTAYNYQDALKMLDSAQRIADRIRDYITVSNCFNSIGNIQSDLNNEEEAFTMYSRALKVAEDNHLPNQTGVALGSLACLEKDPAKSQQLQIRAFNLLKEQRDAGGETGNLLVNIGEECTDPDSAIACFEKAIKIGRTGHLVEIEIAALNNMAYSYAEKNNYPAALNLLLGTAIPLATRERNRNWLSTLYDSYADISHQAGNAETAFIYQKKALEASTFADREHASNQVRLLNSLLQARSRELKILQQDQLIGLQNSKVTHLTYLVIGMACLGLFLVLGFRIILQRKNLRVQRQELESAKIMAGLEEQDKERLSMQLHDLIRPVRNAVSDHIEKLEFSNPSAKLELVNTLEKITASLRQVSHRMNPAMRNKLSFSELVKGIKQDFALSSALNIKMEVVPGDLKLSQDCSNHLYFILHELLANADKHLGKGNVEISVSVELDNLYILYKDDGQGFDPQKTIGNGLGISLIRKRIEIMSSHADVESGKGKGTRWIMVLPVDGNVVNG